MRDRNAERGFSLIELMAVVAIVAILAVVVVPQFTAEAKRSKSDSEVNAMFAELGTKLEQYKIEQGSFLAATKCPASPNNQGYNFATLCRTAGSPWEMLRVNPPESTMRCAYTITVGSAADTLTVPAGFVTSSGGAGAESALASSWWYVEAECDTDGKGAPNTLYYQSSVDTKIQKQNEGS